MQFTPTTVADARFVKPDVSSDDRGCFMETLQGDKPVEAELLIVWSAVGPPLVSSKDADALSFRDAKTFR